MYQKYNSQLIQTLSIIIIICRNVTYLIHGLNQTRSFGPIILLKLYVIITTFTFVKKEKGTQKRKYKNPIVQKFKRCEILKSNNRIIQKSKSSNMQNMWNIKKIYTAFENQKSNCHYSYNESSFLFVWCNFGLALSVCFSWSKQNIFLKREWH